MFNLIFQYIYTRPLNIIILVMIMGVGIWCLLNRWIKYKFSNSNVCKNINLFGTVSIIITIICSTVIIRGEGTEEVILIPFHFFYEAQNQPELYRSMFMNIFLFFPLGLTLPFALPEKWNRRALITILFSMVLSITIEYLQYHYHLGRAETDDVICNTLGAIIGTLSYTLSRKVNTK